MRRAGLALRRRAKRVPAAVTVTDLVKRDFRRNGRNQLWVTDIAEHPTREGKLYCCVVSIPTPAGWSAGPSTPANEPTWPPPYSGWRSTPAAPPGRIPGGIIHGHHGTQFTSWTFTERARRAGLLPSLGTVGDLYDNPAAEAI